MPRGVPGIVIPKKGKRKVNSGCFVKGHKRGGRPKGRMNKFTGEVKQHILDGINSAHEHGMAYWVRDLATDTPTSAAALLGRLIPVSMDGAIDIVHTVTIKFE